VCQDVNFLMHGLAHKRINILLIS